MSSNPPPALRVFLVRHAHAGWPLPGVRDFDRPLDERGREEARRLAATITVNGFNPDRIWCSNARRCVETLEILRAGGLADQPVENTDTLYTANYSAYLDVIGSAVEAGISSIMIIGHNPMLEDAAHALLQNDLRAYQDALGLGFPTAGLLILDCAGKGAAAVAGDARFVDLLSPVDA